MRKRGVPEFKFRQRGASPGAKGRKAGVGGANKKGGGKTERTKPPTLNKCMEG